MFPMIFSISMGTVVSKISNGIGIILDYTAQFLSGLIEKFIPHCTVTNLQQVAQMDDYVLNNRNEMWSSVVQSDEHKIDDGYYFIGALTSLRRKTTENIHGHTTKWVITSISRERISNIKSRAMPELRFRDDENEQVKQSKQDIIFLDVIQFYQSGSLFNREYINRQIRLSRTEPRTYQSNLLLQIKTMHASDQYACINVLISGDPGVGKSYMARLLAKALQDDNKDFKLIEKFNITQAGFDFLRDITSKRCNYNTTIILLLEEFDIAIRQAEQAVQANDPLCIHHASNKQRLLDFIDTIKDTPNIITIFTSNTPVTELLTNYLPYVRDGRMDIRENWSTEITTN